MNLSKLQEIADRREKLSLGGSGYIVEGDRPVACFLPIEEDENAPTLDLMVAMQDATDIITVMNALPDLLAQLTEARAFIKLTEDDGR